MNTHTDFIKTPISTILEDVVSASSGIVSGIESYPISDYIMQSVLLKMTGFQEQKLKCITWEIATNDYEYRRKLLNNEEKLGEYSIYEAKNKVLKNLYKQIKVFYPDFDILENIDRTAMKTNTINFISATFLNTNLAIWAQCSYDYFCDNRNIIIENQFLNSNGESVSLFEKDLKEKYENLYKQRNRLAHNTSSYQQNLPTLKTLISEDDESRNYFIWFSLLLLIDNIFIEMYKIYQEGLEYTI